MQGMVTGLVKSLKYTVAHMIMVKMEEILYRRLNLLGKMKVITKMEK
jgi:hypothetical protein